MPSTELNWNEKMWNQSKKRIKAAERLGTDAVLRCCAELVSDLCCDREQIAEMLTWAAEQGFIDASIPELFRREFGTQSPPPTPTLQHRRPQAAASHLADNPHLAPQFMDDMTPRAGTEPSPPRDSTLPAQLHPYVEAIERFDRKQGRAAVELGAQLCDAQRVCREAEFPFSKFLLYLKKEYGLSRGSCYLYMKYYEWELPMELGSAVMKWIVQGFRRGSPEAQTVIEAAVGEKLTLSALNQRYGVLRDGVMLRAGDSDSAHKAQIIERLTREERRLRERQKAIEERLSAVERRIRQLRTEYPQGPPDEKDQQPTGEGSSAHLPA